MTLSNVSTIAYHGLLDSSTSEYLDLWRDGVDGPSVKGERHIVTKTRMLRYRFYPHFHPYVRELAKRLIEGSVPELQAADTDYKSNSDGTLQALP